MNANESLLIDYRLEGELLKIFTYPSPVLKKVAQEVTEFDDELQTLCLNLLYTMYNAPVIGLASPQVGVSKRIFVMDIDFKREEITRADGTSEFIITNFNPQIFINPIFFEKNGSMLNEEGCLSFPGLFEKVNRAQTVKVEYNDIEGNKHQLDCDELLSICVQHENDHLDGIVFIDRLSLLKKNMLLKKYKKKKKSKVKEGQL